MTHPPRPALFVHITSSEATTFGDVTFDGTSFIVDRGRGVVETHPPSGVVDALAEPLGESADTPASAVFTAHIGEAIAVCFRALRVSGRWHDVSDPRSPLRDTEDVTAELAALLLSLMAETAAAAAVEEPAR